MTDARQSGLLTRLPRPVRRVVVLHPRRLGDFVCATPAFRALRRALPEAEISLLALRGVAPLVRRCAWLDRWIAFPGYPGMAEQWFRPRRATAFFAAMQQRRFDLAIQMHGSGAYSNPVALLLGARYTAGFIRDGDEPGLLDAALPWPRDEHEVRRNLRLMQFLGAEADDAATEFPLWPRDVARARSLLRGWRRPWIGLHPAAREAVKCWPAERFTGLGKRLLAQWGGTAVVLAGPEHQTLVQQVGRPLGSHGVCLGENIPLPVLGAVIGQLDVLVTNDSGPAHIAYALGTPSVTVFGGTDPRHWGPPPRPCHRVVVNRVDCWPCDGPRCPYDSRCLHEIGVPRVAAEVEQALAAAGVSTARFN